MRVVLTAYGADGYSGLPKYFYFLVKHLAMNNVDVEIILDSPDRLERLHEITALPQTKVLGPPITGMITKALYSNNIAKYLKDKDFDILHSCDVLPYFYLKQKNRKPVVFQPFSNEMFQLGARDIRRLLFFVLRSCGQKADALAIISEWQMESMLNDYRVSRDKAFVLPVGIDIDFIREQALGKHKARKELGISSDAFIVLSVNILLPCKGIDCLIKAFKYVSDGILVIVSSGPEENNLKRLTYELGLKDRVIFAGKVPEDKLYNYYASADVFVSPTFLDGSSMGIMEAEVFGLPIVSTHQEFLINGNGYVVPEKNPEALAEGIHKVRIGDKVKMSKRSKEIVKQYDFKEIAKTVIAKYEELLAIRGRNDN